MRMRDLRDFYSPHLTATINGHEFTVKCPTAADMLHLKMIMHNPEKAGDFTDFDEINKLFRGDEDNTEKEQRGEAPTGGLWDELWEHEVTMPEALHLGLTAALYFGIGEDYAIVHWESLGKGMTATPEMMENEPEPEPAKPKPKTRSRKKPTNS